MNKRIIPIIISAAFTLIQAALFYFMIFDPRGHFNEIAYTSIILNCVFALAFVMPGKIALVVGGLVFTVVADYFLIVSSPIDREWGMVAFSCTQICYAAYLVLIENRKNFRKIALITRISLVLAAEIIALIVLKDKVDLVSVLSVFYICNLALSIAFAFTQGKERLLFAIGLCWFIMCDLFVGFSAAEGVYFDIPTGSLLYKIVFADFNFIWFFYAPSQVMIALTVAKERLKAAKI